MGRRHWHPTPVLLPGESQGWRSLVGCNLWGLWVGHDWATSLLLFLSCIGEGNGNPLQCSCPENPRDGGAWWAAVYGVAQSQTWLKRLSSSSSSIVWVRNYAWWWRFSDEEKTAMAYVFPFVKEDGHQSNIYTQKTCKSDKWCEGEEKICHLHTY